MAKVRVKLDFVFEWEGEGIPRELALVSNFDDFIGGGLEQAGVVGNGKAVTLLPGARMQVTVARGGKR